MLNCGYWNDMKFVLITKSLIFGSSITNAKLKSPDILIFFHWKSLLQLLRSPFRIFTPKAGEKFKSTSCISLL